jgi:hypothetical protein
MTTTMTEIVERQVHDWERRCSGPEALATFPRHQQPVITISSAYGSHGQEIGRIAAGLLGFELYDRQLVERIATTAHTRENTVRALDEAVQDWITEHVAGLLRSETFTNSDYLRHLSRVVLALGKLGQAVVIGRGSQFILDPRATLRVRTTAPLAARIQAIAAATSQPTEKARALVLQKDAHRAAFYRLHFNQDPGEPSHYDLILNTSDGEPSRHADLVAFAFLSRFGLARSSVGRSAPARGVASLLPSARDG